MRAAGLVLAAGAGRRFRAASGGGTADEATAGQASGGATRGSDAPPKFLARDAEGRSLLVHAVETLLEAGCDPVAVVLGARAEAAERELAESELSERLSGAAGRVRTVRCAQWELGMGESLRTGLRFLASLPQGGDDGALVTLADLPDQHADLAARLLARVDGPRSLARLTFGGRPGHPVFLGRDHWAQVLDAAHDDVGARELFADPSTLAVEAGDRATGIDVDTPADLLGAPRRWGERAGGHR